MAKGYGRPPPPKESMLRFIAATAAVVILFAGIGPAHAEQATCPAPTPIPTVTPSPAPSAPVSDSTGGQGGAYTDRRTVSFTGAGRTSQYHVFASHIDRSKPVKIHFHLHGDGGWEFRSPTSEVPAKYLAEAKKHNAILVIPKTPNTDSTWWTNRTASDWLAALVQDFYAKYPIDKTDVWFSGFSGGSQALSQHFIPKHYGLIKGGGVVLVGGGGVYTNNLGPAGQAIGKTFSVHYVAGTADTGPGFNAYGAATTAFPKWKAAGFTTTTFDRIYGDNHNAVANDGPVAIAKYR